MYEYALNVVTKSRQIRDRASILTQIFNVNSRNDLNPDPAGFDVSSLTSSFLKFTAIFTLLTVSCAVCCIDTI